MSELLARVNIQRIRDFPYSERDNPDVVDEGSTTEISSVSIAVMVKMNQRVYVRKSKKLSWTCSNKSKIKVYKSTTQDVT